MPELPEVETTRRSLAEHVVGARVVDVRLGKPLRWPLGVDATLLQHRRVLGLQRRGKYLWMPLGEPVTTHGQAAQTPAASVATSGVIDPAAGLLMHLGMSGSLAWLAGDRHVHAPPGPHDHFELITERGCLRLTDPRRFGAVVWSPGLHVPPASELLSRLGPEPFDDTLTPQRFHAMLHAHRAAIKTVLLSGRVMVGAGNIYACEALFDAGIDPRLRADRLSRPRAARLLASLRDTLARAIDAGGTTLRDYRSADGADGSFQHQTKVYAREGEACVVCATPVRRIVQGQRSTFFCPSCQRRG